jgi:hypothetical protein
MFHVGCRTVQGGHGSGALNVMLTQKGVCSQELLEFVAYFLNVDIFTVRANGEQCSLMEYYECFLSRFS